MVPYLISLLDVHFLVISYHRILRIPHLPQLSVQRLSQGDDGVVDDAGGGGQTWLENGWECSWW